MTANVTANTRLGECFNDDNTARRIVTPGSVPCAFVITASAKLNSDIAMLMRDVITSNRLELLVGHQTALEEVLPNIDEYTKAPDGETLFFYERPYVETQALISEMVGLEYQKNPTTAISACRNGKQQEGQVFEFVLRRLFGGPA